MSWRVIIHWAFAMIFIAAATCASAHFQFDPTVQPSPACSHESSDDNPEPDSHCNDCMQIHYLQESAVSLDTVPILALPAFSSAPPRGILSTALPAFRLIAQPPISSSPPVLRI